MPYISQERRRELEDFDYTDAEISAGDLNFMISTLLNEIIHAKGLSYSTINELIGMLECAKLELYRRVAAPYEDLKIKENGDVYEVK